MTQPIDLLGRPPVRKPYLRTQDADYTPLRQRHSGEKKQVIIPNASNADKNNQCSFVVTVPTAPWDANRGERT